MLQLFQKTRLHAYNAILQLKVIALSNRRIRATFGRQRDGHSTGLSGLPFAASGLPRRNQCFFIPLFGLSFAILLYLHLFSRSSFISSSTLPIFVHQLHWHTAAFPIKIHTHREISPLEYYNSKLKSQVRAYHNVGS